MENLCSSFFSFTSLAGMGGGVIMVTLSCPCPSPRHANISCGSLLFMSLTLRESLTRCKDSRTSHKVERQVSDTLTS